MTTGYFAPHADVLWRLLIDRGFDAEAVFRDAGIDPGCIQDGSVRLPFPQVAALWVRVVELIDDPYLGLKICEHFSLSHIGVVGVAWLSSVDLRTGLQRFSRYSRLISDNRSFTLQQGRGETAVVITPDRQPAALQRSDSVMLGISRMCQRQFGKGFQPLRVQFHHAAPEDDTLYRQLFGCDVSFGGDEDRMVVADEVLDRPLAGADPQLARINEAYLCQCLARLDRDDLRVRAMAVILAELPSGTVRMEQVAKGVHLSVRTLQRRLGALGTSFSTLMDETRRELTLQLLRDRSKSLTEIAFSTGFSSLSAFSTAVRQWTGDSPSRFRDASQDDWESA